jgi:hypothetical protein
MGSGQRQGLVKGNDMPGPGNYDLSNINKGKEISFGHGQRDNNLEKQTRGNPGPGTYTSPSFVGKDSQGKTIAGRVKDRKLDDNPGPGTYHSPEKRNGPAFSLLGHRTDDPIMKEKASMPSPGCYDPNDSLTKNKSPNVAFGNRPKVSDLKGDGAPGPGQYQLKTTLGGPNVHIGEKIAERVYDRAPGPGTYEQKNNPNHKAAPSFSISGVTGEQHMPTRGMPGPGTYESPERLNDTGFKFGSEQRKGLASKHEAPGPGQYSIPSRVGNEGKSVLMAGRHEIKQNTNQVGPGQYQLQSTLKGPQYSMGVGEKGTKLNKDSLTNPPPGTYTVDPKTGKSSAPGVVFGKDLRDRSKADNMPGPGNYALPSTITNKGITIEGRHEIKEKDRAPGPGTYDQNLNSSQIRGGNVVFSHGSKSSGLKPSNDPGPGM